MLKRGRKINRVPVRITNDLIQSEKQSNGINVSEVQVQLEIKIADADCYSSVDVAITDVLSRSSRNFPVGQSGDGCSLKIVSEKIDTDTENIQDLESFSIDDDSTENCHFSVNNVVNHQQLRFEGEDIKVEAIELESGSISRDQVDEYLESFCDNEENYSDSNKTPKDVDEEIYNEMSFDETNAEAVASDETDQLFTCDICQMRFLSSSKLQKHVLVHFRQKKKFECEECLRQFSYEGFLNTHKCRGQVTKKINIDEYNESRYKCRICYQTFDTKHYLKKHVKSEGHQSKSNVEIEKPYTCPDCLLSYTRVAYLRSHKCRMHVCETCGMSFSDLSRLEKHVTHHNGEQQLYACTKCKKVYTSLPGLRYHEMNHTGERPHVCTTCGKRFALSSTLKIHQTCHSEQRPFPCTHPTCGKSFSVLSHLRLHELRHTGLRPHGCSHCNKHFTDIPNLRKHLKVHDVDRPLYVCSLCGKQYISLRGLRDHQDQHSGGHI